MRTWSRCAPPACTEHARRKTNTRPDPIKCCSEALPFPWAAASGRRRHRAPCAPIGSLAAGSRPACALGLRVGQTPTAHDASGVAPASAPVRVAAPGDRSPLPVPTAASGPWLPAPPRPPVLPRSHCHLCVVKTSVPLAGFNSKGLHLTVRTKFGPSSLVPRAVPICTLPVSAASLRTQRPPCPPPSSAASPAAPAVCGRLPGLLCLDASRPGRPSPSSPACPGPARLHSLSLNSLSVL